MINYFNFVDLKVAPPRQLNDRSFHLFHAILGLTGEYMEYSFGDDVDEDINELEELGDIMFYLSYLGLTLQLPTENLSILFEDHQRRDDLFIGTELTKMVDLIKREQCYGTVTPLEQLQQQYVNLVASYLDEVYLSDFSLTHVVAYNTEKLSKRYQSTFSQEESVTRKDKE